MPGRPAASAAQHTVKPFSMEGLNTLCTNYRSKEAKNLVENLINPGRITHK
jgi:hypothetical protein